MVSCISSASAMPVEMIMGLPVLATYLISGISTASKGRDFVGWCVQVFQQIDGGVVKRGAENGDAVFARMRKQRSVPVPRRMGFLVQVVERPAVP